MACQLVPPKHVRQYPVCRKGGTAVGVRKVFATEDTLSPKALSSMLDVLTAEVKRVSRSWHHTDHAGTVGAALCWLKRRSTAPQPSTHASRYEQTTSSWERELEQLAQEGVQKWWLA